MKIKDLPKIDRPREKFLEKGSDALTNSELLAILLGSGIKGTNVKVLSQKIIKKFGDNLVNVSVEDLMKISGIGEAKALQIASTMALAKRIFDKQNSLDNLILSAQDAIDLVSDLRDKKQEHLICLYLNARNALIKKEIISVGILDKSIFHPREVFAPGLEMRAAGVILVHNHPSGDPNPSQQDKEVAKRTVEAGKLMGINVIDFLIIAKNGSHSLLGDIKNIQLIDTGYVAEGFQASLFDLLTDADNSPSGVKNLDKNKKSVSTLRFMDFCAGIGGGRLGLENLGLECVGFSEIDKHSERTYREFFGDREKNYGDLMKINPGDLPNFEVMIAGFPCQTFSVMGQRKGMKDDRGQVIYGLIKIMKGKDLPYFILENVKGLVNHNNGNSFRVILDELDKAGYKVYPKVLSSLNHGVPQMRERIYFVGVRKDLVKKGREFRWPDPVKTPKVAEYLIDTSKLEFNERKRSYETFIKFIDNKYNKGLFKVDDLLKQEYLILDTRQSDLRLYNDKVPTLRTGRHGILYVKNGKFRSLSGFEALLLQGFPKRLAEKTKNKINDIYLLSQAGNAMTVSTIESIGKNLLNYIQS